MDKLDVQIACHEFKRLFLESLGWDAATGSLTAALEGSSFVFNLIAQKRGLQVLHCTADKYTLFNRRRLRSLQEQLLKSAHEHIVIYSCDEPRKQVWQWAVRLHDGRRLRHREHPFFSAAPPERLLHRLHSMRFTLAEEESLTLIDAVDRVRVALDIEPELDLFVNRPAYAEQSDRLATAMRSGDPQAFREFVSFHLSMARWGAKRWERYSPDLEAEDREQIAMLGLLLAAIRFRPERGFQFSTYAYFWVRQVCQRYGPECSHLIRIPTNALKVCWPIHARLSRLESRGDVHAVAAFIRNLLNDSPSDAAYWRRFCAARSVRLFCDLEPNQRNRATCVDDPAREPAGILAREEMETLIRAAIDTLPSKDARILRLRYGFDGDTKTLEQIAEVFGLTRERIRQRQESAEEKLRPALAKRLAMSLPPRQVQHCAPLGSDGKPLNRRQAARAALEPIKEALLREISRHPAGISGIDIACQFDLSRSERKAALRLLVDSKLITQKGTGRRTIYRPAWQKRAAAPT